MGNRGTMLQSTVIGLIAIVVAVGLLAYAVIQKSSGTNEVAVHQACGVSVAAKSIKVGAVVTTIQSPFELNCKTETGTMNVKTKDEVLGQISQDVLECWTQFGQGQVDFMNDLQGFFGGDSDRICFICSQKNFGTPVNIKMQELYAYMNTHGPKGQAWNYSQAVSSLYAPAKYQSRIDEFFNGRDKPLDLEFLRGANFDKHNALYIVYAGQKLFNKNPDPLDFINPIEGLRAIAGVAGDYEYFITAGTTEDLLKICEGTQRFSPYQTK